MIPTPTSFFAQSLHAVCHQLAACPTFQIITGASDAAAALSRVIMLDGGRYDDEQAVRPVAQAIDGATINLLDGKAWAMLPPACPSKRPPC